LLSEKIEIDPELKEKKLLQNILSEHLQMIQNFIEMCRASTDFNNQDFYEISVEQKVNNTWEERDFSRSVYMEKTTLSCEIKLYPLFLKKSLI